MNLIGHTGTGAGTRLIRVIAACVALGGPPCLLAQEPPQSPKDSQRASTKIISAETTRQFLDSLQKTTRDTGGSKPRQQRALKAVLDVRLPRIENKCDLKISHELFKVGYATQADHPGAVEQLKDIAESIDRMTKQELRAVTPGCRAELRGFGTSVLRVYLGENWQSSDEQRLKKALSPQAP